MRLDQISPNDELSRLALEGMWETAPIISDLNLYSRSGSSDDPKEYVEGEDKAKITRGLDEDNNPTPGTRSRPPVAKKIVSFAAKIDVQHEDRNEDTATELAVQVRAEARKAGYTFQELCFLGDSGADAEDFDGLYPLADAGKIYDTDTNGIVIPVGGDAVRADQQVALEKLLNHMDLVQGGASHMYMSNDLHTRLLTVGKNLGYYSQSKDVFGNQVDKIRNTIIRSAGLKGDGSQILPHNLQVGTNNDCGMIIMVRWGERFDISALTSVGLKARYNGVVGNFELVNVNMDMALVRQNKNALVVSRGWRLAA